MSKVVITRKDWNAIVRYFRSETKILRDSYGPPKNRNQWPEEYKRQAPEGFKLWDEAREAIESVRGAGRGR